MHKFEDERTFLVAVTEMHPQHHERHGELHKDAAANQSTAAALDLLLQETGMSAILALKE